MKIKYLFILAFFLVTSAYAQNTIYIGTKAYKSTRVLKGSVNGGYPHIGLNGTSEDGDVYLVIGKKNELGLLMLGVKTSHQLTGDIIIYLSDGNAIRCKDRSVKDRSDGESTSVYNLTSKEVEMLQNSDIRSVRFTLLLYGMEKYSWTGLRFDKSASVVRDLFN